ncbi:glycosyltransferase family 2 protein [Halomonas sp. M20]|uniref:glycosyltransferase family 2 protein n=1 Tax=Halomonas sp. M20 TaxID=2763264 RepID=UPI001D0AAF0B|nr:glycosyltransferase family A protein [Halomonas sp. M20]
MANPKAPISLIITTYNDAEYLNKALESALNQNKQIAEIVVIDDGSENDDAEKVVKKYKNGVPDIVFFKKENGGPSSARNLGIQKANQEYITFLDADDYMLPCNIENLYSSIKDLSDDYFGVYGNYINSRTKKQVIHCDFDGIPSTSLVGRNEGIPGCVYSYLIKRNKLLEVDGFDEELTHNEDFDLLIKLLKKGYCVKGSVGAGIYRNYRPGSLTRSDKAYANYQAVSIFLDKAEANNYFSEKELNKRRKANELSLAKKMYKNKQPKYEINKILRRAFLYARPENYREYIAYAFSKIL